ncbi:MAG: hypothetical protein CMH62_00750 [Nanoarchaeota archaeon]|nr:hypothetical protein [Nanoarchaeota archaeon]
MAKKESSSWCCCNSYFWGIFLVVIGAYFILRDLEIIPGNFPFWPIILILFGIYLLSKGKK